MTAPPDDPAVALGPDAAFAANVRDGRLWLQHCTACGAYIFYPRVLCPRCGATDLTWLPASGRGTIHSRAVLHRRQTPGSDRPPQHAIVLIDLEEGPRLMSRLPGIAPEDIRIGAPVRARIEIAEAGPVILFDRAETAA